MPDGFDGPARAWYQQAAQTNGPAITPIYVDAASGKLCMSFVEAVRDGRVVAAVSTDMLLDSMAKMVAAIQATPKSFAFLLDGQGQILARTSSWRSSRSPPSIPAWTWASCNNWPGTAAR